MKKITLLFALLISTAGFSQELVTNGDFQTGAKEPWYGNAANVVELSTGAFFNQAEVTETGAAHIVNLSQEILLSDGVTYTLTFDAFTDDATGSRTMLAGLGQTGAPYKNLLETVTLTSTLQTFTYTFTIDYGDAVTDRVFFDLGADLGFVFIDNVSVQEFVDTTAPADFTASAGTTSAFYVELVLKATDNSGSITYDVTHGTTTTQATGESGVETSMTISGLTPETAYDFSVSASDAAGNTATNNPITISATTVADTSTACAGFSNEASEGAYSVGINYDFQTSGTDVTISFELLDTDKTGFVPQLFFAPSTFVNMDGSNAPTYTATLTSQTSGATISFKFRGAYAGGLVTSKLFDYVVGDDCSTAGLEDFAANAVKMYPNPAKGFVNFSSASNVALDVAVYDMLGKQVLRANAVQSQLNISSLNPGMYFVNMTQGSNVSTKKLVVK